MLEDIKELQQELRSLQGLIESKSKPASLSGTRLSLGQAFETIHQALSAQEELARALACSNDQTLSGALEVVAQSLDKFVDVSQRLESLSQKVEQVSRRVEGLQGRVEKLESNVAWMGS